jgi:hypothetical protein
LLTVSFVYGLIWYLTPIFGASDKLSTTDRKDLVQGFASVAQAAAVGLAGAVGLVGLFFTWRSLRQAREGQAQTQEDTQRTLKLTEQGQITERFTRAIDQLGATDETTGKPKLEIRLGGIYALERIPKDSPKRYYSTVMEVLTAYVRENSRQDNEKPSTPTSGSNENTEQYKDVEQQGQEPPVRSPPVDIQAILDVLNRRENHRSEQHRVRLDLQEANLLFTNLPEANLVGANLLGANLLGANLQGANLVEANLLGAKITDEQLANTLSLQGATMPDGSVHS